MANSKVEQLSSCYRLVAQSFSDFKISFPTDQRSLLLVLVKFLPEFFQLFEASGNLKTFFDGPGLAPAVLVLLAPGAPIHDACHGHVKLFIRPEVINCLYYQYDV